MNIVLQALLIERGIYPLMKLELMDCDVLDYSAERLARSFRVSNLVELNLDYNEFGDDGCAALCRGCTYNKVRAFATACSVVRRSDMIKPNLACSIPLY